MSTRVPCVVDNMVLGRFVDADKLPLLAALGGGMINVTPSIVDPVEAPPYSQQPVAEFARGIFAAQDKVPGDTLMAERVQRRSAFFAARGSHWRDVTIAAEELALAHQLADPATLAQVRATNPQLKTRKVDSGEAECAAIAIIRGWTLWTDDLGIIQLLQALFPEQAIERITDLLVRAWTEDLIECDAAAALYNLTFVGELKLWSRVRLECSGGVLSVK